MAGRVDYYFRQKVSEAELDKGFAYLESADWNFAIDQDLIGLAAGLAVAQQASPNMTVQVSGGSGYDQLGRRVSIASTQNLNAALDVNGAATTVATPGNEKWLSVFAGFQRALSDPRSDGNSMSVYFERAESFELRLVQGAEAGTGLAARPALDGARLLLADIKLIQGQTTVVTANIDTTRRQDVFNTGGSPRTVRRGTTKLAVADLVAFYDNHVTGAADKHAAANVDYGGGAAWADAVTNPATSVEAQLDKIVADLAAATGDVKLGSPARTSARFNLGAGTLGSQVAALLAALNTAAANRVVYLDAANVGPGGGNVALGSSVTYVTTDTFTSVPNVVSGDLLILEGSFSAASIVNGALDVQYEIVNGATVLSSGSIRIPAFGGGLTTAATIPARTVYTHAGATGSVTLFLRAIDNTGGGAHAGVGSYTIRHVRP